MNKGDIKKYCMVFSMPEEKIKPHSQSRIQEIMDGYSKFFKNAVSVDSDGDIGMCAERVDFDRELA